MASLLERSADFALFARCIRHRARIPPSARTRKRQAGALRCASSLHPTISAAFFYPNDRWLPRPNPPRHAQHSTAIFVQPSIESTAGYRAPAALTPRRLLRLYTQLSKSRLTVLNVLTAMAGFALSPFPTTVPVLLSTAVGTALCSAAANTLNQVQEVPFDAQMARTRMRPLVARAMTPLHATGFALVTGVAGPALLWTMVNPTTAILGAANIALYAGPYTWMKRKTILNTWVGSVVGAIPPVMGWTAAGGMLFPTSLESFHLFLPSFLTHGAALDLSLIDNPLSPLAFFMLLFSWQFPHFNSLAFVVRGAYAQGGFHMLSVIDSAKNARVALRHSLLLIPVCSLLFPLSGLTTWAFALTSLVPNAICARTAWRFWRTGAEKEARKLWRDCLWYLPVVMGLLMFHKNGMEWMKWFGLKKDEEDAG